MPWTLTARAALEVLVFAFLIGFGFAAGSWLFGRLVAPRKPAG